MDYIATGLLTGILWMPFFNIGLGWNPMVVGGLLMVLRAWDAITDPVVGNLSDNTRTKWGRRRPFLFLASITTALLFLLFWRIPEAWGEQGRLAYVLGVGLIFFTSFTFWSMPYYGLQLELTPNYDERTRLTAWITLFGKLSSLVGGWLMALVVFSGELAIGGQLTSVAPSAWIEWLQGNLGLLFAWLGQPEPGESPLVVGMRVCSWFLALSIAFFGLLPALFVKERYYEANTSAQPPDPFWKSIKESLRCRPLWSLIAISFFLVLGSSAIGVLGQYVNIYYVCGGDLAKASFIAGLKGTVVVFVGILSIPFFTWLGEIWDKKTVVCMMLGASIGGQLLNFFCVTPLMPYLQILPGVFEASAVAAVWLFLPSMKADVADWDENETLRRREGSINAFYSWFIKAAMTLSSGLGGVVLSLSGFSANATQQPDDVVLRMFWMFVFIPAAIWCIALWVAVFYPLNRSVSEKIRESLESRRGKM